MHSYVKKWGNSASVRIPSAVLTAAALRIDQAVEVRAEDGRIVIEPVRSPAYTLEDLVARISPQNRHDETDTGPRVGGEVW